MVICKYFLQGTCRFGNSCKFEHQLGHSAANSSSILLQNQNKPMQPGATPDISTLVKSVITDMSAAEKGGQWLLSSYAPFKEKIPFHGFEDHSMEEIRYQFYESVKNGTSDQFKRNLQYLLQQAALKIKALQSPSADVINMVKTIYNTLSPNAANSQNQQTVGGFNNPSSSIFSGSAQNTGFLAAPAPSQSIFSTPLQASASNASNIFATPSSNPPSIFATPQQAPPPSNPPNIFANAQQMPSSNPPNIFATSQQVSSSNPPNMFSNFPATAPAPNYSVFSGNQNATFSEPMMQVASQPPSSASEPMQNSGFLQHSANIFGNLAAQNSGNSAAQAGGNVFNRLGGLQSQPNQDFYSKMEDLTEDEIKWFQSDDLDIKSIPEKPPAYEFCFKR